MTPKWTPRQKLVPLPQSFAELQQAANLSFQHIGRSKIFREDGQEIRNQAGMVGLGDGDLALVHLSHDSRPSPNRSATPLLSSHQRAFVPHEGFEPLKPTMSDDSATLTEHFLGQQFYKGTSVYRTEFPRWPRTDPPKMFSQDHDHFPRYPSAPMEISTYTNQFRGHEGIPPIKAAGSDYASVLTDLSKGHLFTGQSSYRNAYPPRQPVPPIRISVNDNDSTLTDQVAGQPFNATSSYQDHFVRHSLADHQVSARPARRTTEPSSPFAGCSEYTNKFVPFGRSPRLRLQLITGQK